MHMCWGVQSPRKRYVKPNNWLEDLHYFRAVQYENALRMLRARSNFKMQELQISSHQQYPAA